jgi:hypothetical protein
MPGNGCSLSAVDDIVSANREKLAGLLQVREGWRYGPQDGTQGGQEYRCFGVSGALRLTILPEMDGFLICVHDKELGDSPRASWIIPRIESVREWLDEHEAKHAGPTPLQEEFRKALEEKARRSGRLRPEGLFRVTWSSGAATGGLRRTLAAMSDDDDTPDAAAVAAPEASKRWSEQDFRILVITIVGGLAANLGTVILVGAALAYVHLGRHHNSSLVLGLFALPPVVLGPLLIGAGYAGRHGRDFLFSSGVGEAAAV